MNENKMSSYCVKPIHYEPKRELKPVLSVKVVCDDDKYMPIYANQTDACMDLKIRVDKARYILPGTTVTFGTGIKVSVPEDHVMLVFPRSSTGMKLHCSLANGTGIIDSGYRDEIKIALHNFGDYSVEVEDGQRICQFMIIPRPPVLLYRVPDDEKFRQGDRGGGIGSTGK